MTTSRLHAAVVSFLLALSLVPPSARAEPAAEELPVLRPEGLRLNEPSRGVVLRARAEFGALGVLAHHIQYGRTGTRVDYREDANQDTLFFFARLSAELELRRRHTLIFLYQPLAFETEAVIGRELAVGEVRLPENTPVRFGYGFDFYRIAYHYDVFSDARRELAFGGGFQIRNARVSFITGDGARGFTQTNLGVVPLLRIRGRYVFDNALFLESELDGWVSPVPTEGRADEPALGAIADASLRVGAMLTHWSELFLTLRYLGGGFRGESSDDTPLAGEDRWNSNWLHTLTFSLGVGVR